MLPLFEREHELARLDEALLAARAGAGSTLLVEGAAGIGKTSLLAAARERAAAKGMTVLHARGTPLEHDFAMGVTRQCLEPVVRADADAERLFAGAARLARPVLLDAPNDGDAAPAGALHGLYWLVANLADRTPLLFAIDDAHWADEPSLRFVAYLARRVESLPVALAVCTRNGEPSTATTVVAEIRAEPVTEVLEPAPLGVPGVEALLRELDIGAVEEPFARACREATGGNPFLLSELIRGLDGDTIPFTAAGAARISGFAPPTVARTTRNTLDRLGPEARGMAHAVAVLGEDVELSLAAELAVVPMDRAAGTAADLARAGILDDAMPLRFRHPILAGAVRDAIAPPERAESHRRAAELLRARGAGLERVALQLTHTPAAADERVVADLRLAAERACSRGAPATAVTLLARALAEPPAAVSRADVLLELGQAQYATGRSAQAASHLEEAFRCAASPVVRGRALIALFQAAARNLKTQWGLAPLIAQALPEVEPHDRELALRLRALLILATEPGGELDVVMAAAARLEGATAGEAIVLGQLCLPMMCGGATAAEVADIAGRAASQADTLLEEGATALVMTGPGLGLYWADRLDACQRLLDQAVGAARQRGSTVDLSLALKWRAWMHHRAGRLLEAEADARTAIAAGGEEGWAGGGAGAFIPLLAALTDQGRIGEAVAELEAGRGEGEVVDAPAMTDLLLERMRLRAALGEHALALEDWRDAVGRLTRLFGLGPAWVGRMAVAAGAHRALGEREAADEIVAQALALAQRWGTPGAIGEALHAAGRLSSDGNASDLLRESVWHLERSPARLEHARALVSLGGRLRRDGRRADSRKPLRQGYELARECGAAVLADSARVELRASGVRLRRDALSGADALTASERRIAEMAAAGESNAEIAQGLFLTVKTVEMHLTNAYRKLDVAGRGELSGALAG